MSASATIYLGDRQTFLDRLDRVLLSEDAVLAEGSREITGRHVVIQHEARFGDGVIFIEDDSYLGRSLVGPPRLVKRIARLAFGIGDTGPASGQ